jgi:hypothetical protein
MLCPEALRTLTLGYDLDGGGYEFEAVPETHPLGHLDVACWDDPDLDYFGFQDSITHDQRYGHSIVLFFAPGEIVEYPETYTDEQGDRWEKIAEGQNCETDHECCCHGRLDVWTGAAGEPREPEKAEDVRRWLFGGEQEGPLWKDRASELLHEPERFRLTLTLTGEPESEDVPLYWNGTGNSMDKPYPLCDRCDGEGTVVSPGGSWAIYAQIDEPEDDEDDCGLDDEDDGIRYDEFGRRLYTDKADGSWQTGEEAREEHEDDDPGPDRDEGGR